MSYDIKLLDPVTKKVILAEEPHHIRGGTYVHGGNEQLWLNITYNYSDIFQKLFPKVGIRRIYGLSGAESIPILKKAIVRLNDDGGEESYWTPTEGNVKRALCGLLAFAQIRPDGIWDGD